MAGEFDWQSGDDYGSSAYNALFLLSTLAATVYALAKYAEYRSQLDYESRAARILFGCIKIIVEAFHAKRDGLIITDHAGQVVAIGPHRTGLVDAASVVAKMEGVAPHAFATDAYNSIPGAQSLMQKLNAITIKAEAKKESNGHSANAAALEQAGAVLQKKGCIVLFPQGNFSKIGQEPFRVYEGAARLAIDNQAPIRIIRLDGLWSINNSLLPLFIRNNSYYRALGSFFHMNNVRVSDCGVIDFHLKADSKNSTREELIREICAQLYAFYRQTGDLSKEQVQAVKSLISGNQHLLIWDNKLKRDKIARELVAIDREREGLEQQMSLSAS